jgi:hypothetical protein
VTVMPDARTRADLCVPFQDGGFVDHGLEVLIVHGLEGLLGHGIVTFEAEEVATGTGNPQADIPSSARPRYIGIAY